MTPIPGPVLHIHVSGSAGTFFCELARKQNSSSKSFAGGAYACEVPCGNNHAWKRALDTTGINMKFVLHVCHPATIAARHRFASQTQRPPGKAVKRMVNSAITTACNLQRSKEGFRHDIAAR